MLAQTLKDYIDSLPILVKVTYISLISVNTSSKN